MSAALTPHTQELWHRQGGTAPWRTITASLHYAPARTWDVGGRWISPRQVLRGVWGQSSSTLQRNRSLTACDTSTPFAFVQWELVDVMRPVKKYLPWLTSWKVIGPNLTTFWNNKKGRSWWGVYLSVELGGFAFLTPPLQLLAPVSGLFGWCSRKIQIDWALTMRRVLFIRYLVLGIC